MAAATKVKRSHKLDADNRAETRVARQNREGLLHYPLRGVWSWPLHHNRPEEKRSIVEGI